LNPALDKTVYVDSLRVGDSNRIARVETDAGGKGINASRMLRTLGGETIALGLLGGRTGQFIEHVLKHEGVPTDFVKTTKETRTNIQIQTSDGAPPTVLNEKGGPVRPEELEELLSKVAAVAPRCSFVIFGGSIPQNVPADIYQRMITAVRAAGARAILDADGDLLLCNLTATPFMIKPNRDEARRLVGHDLTTDSDAVRAANVLRARGIELVAISLGADGCIAANSEGTWKAIPPKVDAVSTVGCGDSMVAGIALALSRGDTLREALCLGSAAGAATAMSSGAEMGRLEDIERLVPLVSVMRL
jgi:1-phosphofructokinase